jgi:putative SOS response-associated peptidase YedK
MRWAIIPPWEPKPTTKLSTINARAETVATSRLYSPLFLSGRRCLIPANGFYEWRDTDHVPHYIHPTTQPCFTFAGLWSRWEPPDDSEAKVEALDTFTVITTAANELIAPLHERMPAVLTPEEWEPWLDPRTDPARLQGFIATRKAHGQCVHRILQWPAATGVPQRDLVPLVGRRS